MNLEFITRQLPLNCESLLIAGAIGTTVSTVDEKGQVVAFALDGTPFFQKDVSEHLDLSKAVEMILFESFIAVFNTRGLTGVVIDLEDSEFQFPLSREDYHCENCSWSIGWIKLDGVATLIHSTLWNRIDFTQLPSGKLLTDRVVKFFKDKDNINYLDYFHSQLFVAPDQKHFVVNGWHWQPWDQLWSWNVERFLKDYEPSGTGLNVVEVSGYNWDRPCCFIDNQTIAWGYNAREAGSDVAPDDQPTELIFQDINTKEIVKRISFENFDLSSEKEVSGRLWFEPENRLFVVASEETGTTVTDEKGNKLWQHEAQADFVNTKLKTIGLLDQTHVSVVNW